MVSVCFIVLISMWLCGEKGYKLLLRREEDDVQRFNRCCLK